MSRRAAWPFALVLVACSSERTETHGTTQQRIIAGTTDTTTRSVLVAGDPDIACSAFVVSEDIILTASHCTAKSTIGRTCDAMSYPTMYGPKDIIVMSTDDMNDSKAPMLAVAEVIPLDGATTLCGNDIVALRLARPTDLVPIVPRLDVAPSAGEHVTTIGFGLVDPAVSDSMGPRRRRDDAVVSLLGPKTTGTNAGTDLTDADFAVSIGPCHGDSGGPALDASGRAIGVMSRGPSTCTDMIYTRLDAHADWLRRVVRSAAEARGAAVPDWAREADAGAPAETPDASDAPTAAPTTTTTTSSCSAAGAPARVASPVVPWALAALLVARRRRRR